MQEFKKILFVVLGSLSIAYSAVAFLNPNSVITGGGVGLAQLFYALFPLVSLGAWIAIVSVPLILIGMRYFGKAFVVKTLISIALISLFTDLLKDYFHILPATNETILAAIFGGFLIGLGVGLVMLGNSSTGGTTIIAEIISKKTHYKTSQIILVIDAAIMFSAIFVYGDVEKALFSIVGVYVTSRVVDMLLSGKPAQKAVSIVTHRADELAKHLAEHFGEHGTILQGVNLGQENSRTLILIIVDISRLQFLKESIKQYDPDSYLVIQEASELYGREF